MGYRGSENLCGGVKIGGDVIGSVMAGISVRVKGCIGAFPNTFDIIEDMPT